MRITLSIIACLLLAACKSEAEEKAEWLAFCVEGEFTAKQCTVLYTIAKSSADAKHSADWAQINSSINMGLTAGSAGGRR